MGGRKRGGRNTVADTRSSRRGDISIKDEKNQLLKGNILKKCASAQTPCPTGRRFTDQGGARRLRRMEGGRRSRNEGE